ncbi:outer membrane beta-barrel protein [Pontibacter litorisediminis]|uniref:outer membrane beta-barrel protein n=1 Tax=Pontibacter litorisediminis TaxID=1846260 RepID=UPI0023EA9692|nr:outer membrane beta-barrel protein [Pontibacter litorisediminis]
MNKFYTFLLSFLLLAGSGFAQSAGGEAPKNKYYGVKAGANFSNFTGDTEGLSMQTGFHAGLYALYMESQHVGIQPEIQYSAQGAAFRNGHLRMHYAVVTVMLKVFPVPTFSLHVGPYAAFLLSDKVETDSYPAQYKGNGQDFGFAYGLSFGKEGKLTVSARHQVGLFNLSEEGGKIKNQVFQVSLGICMSKRN